jgi:hypothetical protein
LGELDIIYKVRQHISAALGSSGAKPKSGDSRVENLLASWQLSLAGGRD